MDGVLDIARPRVHTKCARRRLRPVTGVLVKNMQYVLTIRIPLGERAVDVSYFADDIAHGQVTPGARPVSVTLCDPDVPPTKVKIPTTQIRAIEARLASRK